MFHSAQLQDIYVVLKEVVMGIFEDDFWGFVELLASVCCPKC